MEIELDLPSLEVTPATPSSPVASTVEQPEQSSRHAELALNRSNLTVRNPLENTETIRFLVNSRIYELQPGEAHQFPPGEQWLIQFHPGGDFQDIDRTVTTGIFQFVITQQGWDLVPIENEAR